MRAASSEQVTWRHVEHKQYVHDGAEPDALEEELVLAQGRVEGPADVVDSKRHGLQQEEGGGGVQKEK